MWPNTTFRGRGRGDFTSQSPDQYPSTSYVQTTAGSRRGGQPFNYQQQNRGKWGRARPQQNYFHNQDVNSRQTLPPNGRGRGAVLPPRGRGGGLIDSAVTAPFAPSRQFGPQFNKASRYNYDMTPQEHRSPSAMSVVSARNARVEQRARREVNEGVSWPGKYFCPKCDNGYQFQYIHGKCIGKLPLVLHCGHTMCQECIYQNLKNNKINCAKCHLDSTLTQEQTPVCQTDLNNVFRLNYHIYGVISFHRSGEGRLKNLDSIGFVTETSKRTSQLPDLSESCCFSSCTKPATMYCPSCDGIYCSECSIVVHKSAKNLMSHQPVPKRINKFTLALENCNQHPKMPVEFFCKTCDLSACCYCALNQHSDHDRDNLYHLNEAEMAEFTTMQKSVKSILKQVLTAQKKVSRLTNFDTVPLKKQVCNYFAYFHSHLQIEESKLLEELDQFKGNNHGLEAIQTSLRSSAEQLKQLIALDLNRIGDKKLNLRAALLQLRKLREIPRFLMNDAGQSFPIRFVPDESILSDLSHRIVLEKCEDSEYRLLREEDLPEGYVIEQSDEEVDKSITALLDQSELPFGQPSNYSSTGSSLKSKTKRPRKVPAKKKPDMDRVEVQHINSMDSFFVHLKKDQVKLAELTKDLESYVKMGGAEAVAEPELNGIYLVLYVNKSHNKTEEMWCRARLHNILNQGEETLYDMFFIDYGKTQAVNKNRIRDIPPSLCQKKPFAIECMLHNPMNTNWNEKAHYSLARILSGKDVFMLEKSLNQGIYEVDLMIAGSDGGMTSVFDILVHAHQVVDPIDDAASSKSATTSKQINYGGRLIVFPNSKTFVKNQKEKVVIANIVDPHNIFVHVVQHQEVFKNTCQAIKKIFKKSKDGGCIPINGTYALVEYKDPVRQNYHRAFVKSVDLTSDKVHVLLVDWGLNVVVSTNCVRPLEEPLTKLESQAVLVKLAHIAPYNQSAVWSRVSSDFLQVYFKSRDVLKMMVHNAERELEVALFDCSKNVDVCINSLMVEHNYADSTGPISTKLNWPQYEPNNPVFKEEDGLMSSLLKKVIDNTNDESDEEDDELIVSKKRIEVIKVESPSLIWIKFLDLRDKERELHNGLQAHYSTEAKTKSEWEVGDLCVVELNETFYRGTVQEVQDGKCKVFLIDKIVEETVFFDKMFVYVPFFTQFPQVASKCHLANIRPAGGTGNWSISSVEALQEFCAKNHRLYAGITTERVTSESKEKTMPIYMWYGLVIRGGALDPDRIKYISINNSLAKLGFAYKIPTPKIKKVSKSEDLLEGLIKESDDLPSQEAVEKSETVDKEAAGPSSEKSPSRNESLIASKSGVLASDIQSLSLEDQPVSDEKTSVKKTADQIQNWNEIIDLESADDDDDKEKAEVALADWLPPLRLLSSEFEARVTCVETGGHLYLHDKSVHQAYENIEANIKQFFENEPPEWTAHDWVPGNLCIIKYTDGNWYRGKVLKVISPQRINVFMIDFGSDHDLPVTALYRELLYTNIPAFATKVKLDKVYARSGTWLTSDYDHFQSLVSDWCRIVVQGPKEVELPLVEVYNVDGECVNKKLIELCPNLSRCAVFPVQGNEEESDDSIVIEDIEPVHVDLTCNVLDTKYDVLPLPQELLEGNQLLMEIGGVFNFRKITIRSGSADESEVLSIMINEIQDLVSNLPPLTDFQVGTPCLAPFSEDEIYYRAKIIDVQSNLIQVLFVDYGNHESVPVNELKTIPLRYLQLPQQCWEADLNIEPANEDSDLTSITRFVQNLDRRKRRIKLVKEVPLTVDIYNKNGKLGYAQQIQEGSIRFLYQDS